MVGWALGGLDPVRELVLLLLVLPPFTHQLQEKS
jgi:hypothetical protein